MKVVRDAKINHHCRKTPFAIKVVEHLQNKAHHVATYQDAYSQEPKSGAIVDQINTEVKQLIDEQHSDNPSIISEPLQTSTQLDIISRAVGQKNGLKCLEWVGILGGLSLEAGHVTKR